MDWITTSGRTLDEAKSNALDQLGIVADEAEFDVVNDVEKGLFGRVKTEAKIRARVRPKQPAAKEERGGRRRSNGGKNQRNGRSKGKGNNGGNNKSGASDNESGRNGGGKSQSASSSVDSGRKSGGNSRSAGNKNQSDQGSDNSQSGNQRKSSGDAGNNRNRNRNGGGNGGGRAAATPKPEKKRDTVEHEISREDQERTAQEFLEGVLGAFDMTGSVSVVEEAADDDAIELSVSGDELGLLVGQKGITLNALQELTRTVVQRKADGAKTDRLRVDVAGYRARRTVALQGFTRTIAADVLESGTEKLLEPMGPADRKVVHDTVNDIEGVETGSEGEEPRRRVVIRPV